MARKPSWLTKRDLDSLLEEARADPTLVRTKADADQRGLYVQARRGRVRYLFRFRSPVTGSRRQIQIDWYGAITLAQARAIAQELRAKVAAGVDPKEAREAERRAALSLGDAVEGYLQDLKQRAETGAKRGKRSGYASARRRLERHVLPNLGEMRIREVAAEDVRRLHRDLQRTPVEANRALTALSAVFGWADREQLIPPGTNPTRHVERFAEKGTRRALTKEELSALGVALQEAEESRSENPSVILAIRLLALTGCRRAEVLGHMSKNRRGTREGLRWSDVSLEEGRIQLHDSKTGPQTRVIGQPVIELLRAAKPEKATKNDCVCPGRNRGQPYSAINKARRRLWEAAGLEGVDLHSLRHTFASIGAHVESGRYVSLVAPLLGHGYQARSVTERYIHSNLEALRPAADSIAGEIARLLGLEDKLGEMGPA
jgi:integrase